MNHSTLDDGLTPARLSPALRDVLRGVVALVHLPVLLLWQVVLLLLMVLLSPVTWLIIIAYLLAR